MKNIFLLILMVTTVLHPIIAKEKKKSKKQVKQEQVIEAAVQPFKDKTADLEAEIAKLNAEKKQLVNELNVLNEENKALQKEAMMMAKTDLESPKIPEGLSFKIQLGAYNANIVSFFQDQKKLETENVAGKNKYVIGYFESFEQAKNAEKDFKKLGIRDAWLVPYKNGFRISDADANNELNFDIRKAK